MVDRTKLPGHLPMRTQEASQKVSCDWNEISPAVDFQLTESRSDASRYGRCGSEIESY
jgi:hypothetical protein